MSFRPQSGFHFTACLFIKGREAESPCPWRGWCRWSSPTQSKGKPGQPGHVDRLSNNYLINCDCGYCGMTYWGNCLLITSKYFCFKIPTFCFWFEALTPCLPHSFVSIFALKYGTSNPKFLGLKWLPVAELGEVDKVPAHHVGEVGHSWREDRLHPEASDLFVKVVGGFDLETRHFHIHHFVLKGEK